jgi:DNA-binding NtrC family response regulator
MAEILSCAGHDVQCCASAVEALRLLDQSLFDVVITDLRMPGMSGLEFIRALEQRRCEAQIVMVTAHGSVAAAVDAMRHGAFDFIEKPFKAEQLEDLVSRAMRHGDLVGRRSSVPAAIGHTDAMVGQGPAMQELRRQVAQVAPTGETVLITGESGVGKELVALALHRQSQRHAGPMVIVNCAAIAATLAEDELFGHCKGAFTGADHDRAGFFQQADEGTLFLDEIGELPPEFQAKLLRVIETKQFRPVGAIDDVQADVRIIAATNRDLAHEVQAGRFRKDLYHRLGITIPVPPLQQHVEDIPILVDHFLSKLAVEYHRSVKLTEAALRRLQTYSWPGNVRQLRSVLENAVAMTDGNWLDACDLRLADDAGTAPGQSQTLNLEKLETWAIRAALNQCKGNISQAARELGIHRDTLMNKMKKYGIEKSE